MSSAKGSSNKGKGGGFRKRERKDQAYLFFLIKTGCKSRGKRGDHSKVSQI